MDDDASQNWRLFDFSGTGTWPEQWPPMPYRQRSPTVMEFRLDPPEIALNRLDGLHGAFLAGLAENCLGLFLYEKPDLGSVTVSLSLDYPAAGRGGAAIDGVLDLIRETGRMQFLRITLSQGDTVILHGNGVVRKFAQP